MSCEIEKAARLVGLAGSLFYYETDVAAAGPQQKREQVWQQSLGDGECA